MVATALVERVVQRGEGRGVCRFRVSEGRGRGVCGVWVSGAKGRGRGGWIDRCVGLAWIYDADEHAREDPWEGRYCILIGCYVGWFVPFCYFYFKPFQIGFL
jgi:hypothetical protein